MNPSLHLVYLCGEYPPASHGGIGTFTRAMAHAMVARGHTVTVLGVQRGLGAVRDERDGLVRVLRLPSRGGGAGALADARALGTALATVHAQQPVQLIEGPEGAFALLPLPRGVARVVRLHGGHHFFAHLEGRPLRRWRAWAERRSLRRATHLCAVSDFVARTTAALVPSLAARPVTVLPNPVDTQQFAPRPGVAPHPGRVLFVGTLCDKKGVRELLQAFAIVAPQWPHATLELIGRDSRDPATGGSYAQAMAALVPSALFSRVRFAGVLANAEVAEALARTTLFVFPSKAEAQGLAALEAMATGAPCIISARGPGPETAVHEESALLVDPTNVPALAAAMTRLLGDAPLRAQLGAAARARCLAHFDLAQLAPRNEAFYTRCVAEVRDG
ncbi:MAG: glycosyltransferase family 4 protein [Gemmatimonas sp.]|uniref:glycosyltransferase family 4 protein n=1 Tax=Gemmatimonas sp. TaxID=1962908 RepID=UPI0025C16C97|nr:glycosyltransferase family 4 protein [Gemmatimonas sp.]MCA2987974.1 glycosyltransferase family 4 protein [Gemmatimonas sp.]